MRFSDTELYLASHKCLQQRTVFCTLFLIALQAAHSELGLEAIVLSWKDQNPMRGFRNEKQKPPPSQPADLSGPRNMFEMRFDASLDFDH
ncbi:hypothetical protein NDN08_005481 [Rhodosorus marinus]|uniref:Uncharacterized protein n=1 Tax=Rhodosorus marinus TaxID=101924 RepID=A0AAV8V3W5_9RHOD|nr:hypothetical protein NDN08_005481 [Rhodosorus marinus]